MSHRVLCFMLLASLVGAIRLPAQEAPSFPQPGPEHAHLKALEGTWDAKMKMADAEEALPAEMTCKMECGGLWLATDFKADVPGFKFHGKGLDSFDPASKQYVAVWVDSMITSPLRLAGTFDEKTKTLTMKGEGPGTSGKIEKFKNVTTIQDADQHKFEMYMVGEDGQEKLQMTIEYARKK
jgi:hypothetical protein